MNRLKITCSTCGRSLDKEVAARFEQFKPGTVICPKCNTHEKRYISELDLMIYFGLCCVLYGLGAFALFQAMDGISSWWISIPVMLAIIVCLYFATKYGANYIYLKAPFKQAWKDVRLDEDREAVSNHIKWQFFAFMVVALMFGTSKEYTGYFFLMIAAFAVIVAVKVHQLIRIEQQNAGKVKHR